MDEEELPSEIKYALADRLEGWELVELLSIPVWEIIEIFEAEIMASLPELLETLNMEPIDGFEEDE